jgi:formamidopyrimidine-DNA glycosylase
VPELPDVTVYVEKLSTLLVGQPLTAVRLKSPFLLRSVDPPLSAATGKRVVGVQRLGKRIVFALEDELFLVIHLMIAGRFRWGKPGAGLPGKIGLAAFDFPAGTLLLTEASAKKRASLHVVAGADGLAAHDRGGLELMQADRDAFAAVLASEQHTLKRALTDPRLFSGIGNAYSDEILHAARLSPFKRTRSLDDEEIDRLFAATIGVLKRFTELIREQAAEDPLPRKVTAFRDEMAVHGRYRQPCPDCGAPVQHILYAENESNYCARCQTGGKLLADRVLSQLMKDDWPKTLEELEQSGGPRPA